MNTYYSAILFFLMQLAIKHNKAKVTIDTVCKNGYLIQMSNHFECVCDDGHVHVKDDVCEQKQECKEGTKSKPCADFSTCVLANTPNKYTCMCAVGYTNVKDVCVPSVCKNVSCDKGKCILDPNNEDVKTAICSCDIGKVPDPNNKNMCTKDGETKCTLKCLKSNETCKVVEGRYKCDCEDGFSFDKEEGICTAYSVFNIVNLSIIFIIALTYLYII
ncbi:ookinete surface protein P25 [Plasmodium brasilianum]|uniref:Ookinete surface protein P25 n=1 Tax=Plasmodium brasilianum TaxID=5824 RepID=A0ACB9Y9K3_PLABR|nr:ookinete surface protein P25 [Plasmodium brasilianum]